MKLLCIDASNQPFDDFQIKENETYEPQGAKEMEGVLHYLIFRTMYFEYWYEAWRFVQTSDKCEMQMEAKKKQSITNLFKFL